MLVWNDTDTSELQTLECQSELRGKVELSHNKVDLRAIHVLSKERKSDTYVGLQVIFISQIFGCFRPKQTNKTQPNLT